MQLQLVKLYLFNTYVYKYIFLSLYENVHTTSETKDQMKGCLFSDVVIVKSASFNE